MEELASMPLWQPSCETFPCCRRAAGWDIVRTAAASTGRFLPWPGVASWVWFLFSSRAARWPSRRRCRPTPGSSSARTLASPAAAAASLLTTGYEPAALKDFPGGLWTHADAKVKTPTAYRKFVTWTFDPDSGQWDIAGPAPLGLDTPVTTRLGVMGVSVDWRTRLNDAGYDLKWSPDQPEKDNAVFL